MFDENNSMTIYFFKTTEMKESIYVKITLRPSPIINNENVYKYCFLRSKLANLNPC